MRDTEKDILELLYSRYYDEALLYCLTLCGSRETAEDLVEEAFIKAYLSLPGEVPSFRYWLFRVCKNLWIDQLRKQKWAADSDVAVWLAAAWAAEQNTPEAEFLKSEGYRCLWDSIGTLPQADREIVMLHYFFDMPLHEIARLQDKSYPAVRQRLVRLRQTLKKRLEEQGDEI